MFACPACRATLSQADLRSGQCPTCSESWESELPAQDTPAQTLIPPDVGEQVDVPSLRSELDLPRSPKVESLPDGETPLKPLAKQTAKTPPSTPGTLDVGSWKPELSQAEETAHGNSAASQGSAAIPDAAATDTNHGEEAFSTIEQQPTSTGAESAEDAIQTYWKELSQGTSTPTVTLQSRVLGSNVGQRKFAGNAPQRSLRTADGTELTDADYEIVSVAGEGSMGKVFLARQNSIQRFVAVKQLKPKLAKQAKHRTKFLAEAAVTGELDHPNIVPVHDLGVSQNGELFYSMKMIRGQSWQELIGKKGRGENIEVLLRVADAIAYAHSKKIIHRDLKPENVMLGNFGEVLVTDWGIAIQLDKDQDVALAGTPAYMAPEMAQGPPSATGIHSDIYLLGAILFQIIVGKAPHHLSEDTWEVLSFAAANTIVETDRDDELLTIARQAMATKPQERYPTVEHFQAAVRAYQTHAESIVILQRAESDLVAAKATKSPESFSKALFGFQDAIELWSENRRARHGLREAKLAYAQNSLETENFELGISLLDAESDEDQPLLKKLEAGKKERDLRVRRLRVMRVTAFSLFSGLGAVLLGASVMVIGKNTQLKSANVDLSKAVEAKVRAVTELASSNTSLQETVKERDGALSNLETTNAQLTATIGQRDQAVLAAAKKAEDAKKSEEKALQQKKRAESLLQPALRGQFISKIALAKSRLDANESTKAVSELVSLREDALLSDLADWEWDRLYYLGHPETSSSAMAGPWQALTASADGNLMATASPAKEGSLVQLWLPNRNGLPTPGPTVLARGMRARNMAISPDKRFLAVGGRAAQKLEDQPLVIIFRMTKSALIQDYVMTAADYFRSTDIRQGYVDSLAFHPTRPWLITAGAGPYALIVRQENSRSWAMGADKLPHRGNRLLKAVFAPDGSAIAVINQSRERSHQGIYIWPMREDQIDLAGGSKLKLEGDFRAVTFFPKEATTLAIGVADGRVFLWNWQTQDNPLELSWHRSPVRDLCFNSTGNQMASASNDRLLQVWERDRTATPTTGWRRSTRVPELKGHTNSVIACQFIGSNQLVSLDDQGGHQGQPRFWDIDQYFDELTLKHDAKERLSCNHASFGRLGKVFVTAGSDGFVRLWQGLTAETPGVPLGSSGLYVGHPRVEGTAANISASPLQLPDAQRMAIATYYSLVPTAGSEQQDGSLCCWDAESGRFLFKVATGRAELMSATADSHYVALGRQNLPQKVDIWNIATATGRPRQPMISHGDGVTTLAFRPQSHQLFVGRYNGTGRLLREPFEQADVEFGALPKDILQSRFSARGEWLIYTGKGKESYYLWARSPEQDTALAKQLEFSDVPFHLDTAMASSAHRTVVVSGNNAGRISANRMAVVELESGQPVKRYESDPGPILGAAISPDGKTILALTQAIDGSHQLVQWLPDSNQQSLHPLSRQLAAMSPHNLVYFDTDRLLTYGKQRMSETGDGVVAQVWDLASQRELGRMVSGSSVLAVRHLPDQQQVVAACQSGIVYLWDVTDPRRPKIISQIAAPDLAHVYQAAITQNSDQVAMIGSNKAVVLKLSTSEFESITSDQALPKTVASSTAGIAIAFDGYRIWVRRAAAAAHWLKAESSGKIKCLCMAADSSAVAAQIGDLLYLWTWENGKWQEPIEINRKGLDTSAMVFSASKKRLLTGDQTGSISVLQIDRDSKSVSPLFSWKAHTSGIRTLEFSADGKHLASTCETGEAVIWPTQTEQPVESIAL